MTSIGRIVLLFALSVIALGGEARAQQTASETLYPTLAGLDSAEIPVRDRVDLARRIDGVASIPAPPQSVPTRQVGEQDTFWVNDFEADRTFQIDATLRVVGKHIYLWVEDNVPVNDADLQALADAFDTRIYDPVRALWGSEDVPGVDGDPHIYGIFASGMGDSTLAYFTSQNSYPSAVVKTSNQHEMFIFNLDYFGGDTSSLEGTIAHEFQHMIRHRVDGNEDTWLDEGFSVFTERYLGYDTPFGFAVSFLSDPDNQLNAWSEHESRAPDYGAAFLFVTYFYERFGLDALRALGENPANGLKSFDTMLRGMGGPGVDEVFADWALANFLLNPGAADGRYGYRTLWDDLPGAAPRAVATTYPYSAADQANQYGTHYYVLTNLRDSAALDISLSSPATVQLVPTTPASGRWMWYSNRGDESDTTLTRAFDLSGVRTATLTYGAWYHLEELWDFAYVMISDDDGLTWTPLATPFTTDEDPLDSAYGPGYTGESGGWIRESLSLDQYAGRRIRVRFEMITDDAVNQPGMVIDDVAIPEIGYSSDFEADGGGWDAQGWIRIDNTLPQRVWVQAAQQAGRDVTVSRWSAPVEQRWTLPLVENVDQVVLAVSPFAPVTTVPMPYTLNVTAR